MITTIFAGAKIYSESQIGNNCTIHSGVIIGSDGKGNPIRYTKKFRLIK